MKAYRLVTVVAALAALAVLFGGCSGDFAQTLPSPDGIPAGLDTRLPLVNQQTQTPITGATPGQFTIEEKPAGAADSEYRSARVTNLIEDTSTTGGQYNVALVLDRSGSMSGSKINDLKAAATEFVNLLGANDQVEIVSYDDIITVEQTFTSDKALLNAAIARIYARGLTASWSAAQRGLDDVVALQRSGYKAVMLMTDGDDNSSSITLQQLISNANAADVPVYCVGFQAPTTAQANLQQLATSTGAMAWFPFDAASISAAFAEFQQVVSGGYQIFWNSNFEPGDRIDARITYNGPGGPITTFRTNIEVPATPVP